MFIVILALLGLGAVAAGGQRPAIDDFVPPTGCNEVTNATTRGGAELTSGSKAGGGFGCNSPPARDSMQRVLVRTVIDGDTIKLASGEVVRYIGIDAPEEGPTPEHLAREATKANRELVEGRYVHLVQGIQNFDQFGRLLRYVFVDGILVEADLVREGLARTHEYQFGQTYAQCIGLLEEDARANGRGVWGE
jgi:micrococcal nuclease